MATPNGDAAASTAGQSHDHSLYRPPGPEQSWTCTGCGWSAPGSTPKIHARSRHWVHHYGTGNGVPAAAVAAVMDALASHETVHDPVAGTFQCWCGDTDSLASVDSFVTDMHVGHAVAAAALRAARPGGWVLVALLRPDFPDAARALTARAVARRSD